MNKDFIELERIVDRVFNENIKSRRRKREIVYARMVFSKILRDRGYTTTDIAKYINKDHTTIVHYGKTAINLMAQFPSYKSQYLTCYTEFMMDKDKEPLSFTEKKLYSSILSLKDDLEMLNLSNISLKEQLEKHKRLKNIIEFIDNRTPTGKEFFILKKINQMFNGITDYEQKLE